VNSSIKFFREEYEEHVRLGRCPLGDEGRRPMTGPAPDAGADAREEESRTGVSVTEVLE